MSATRDLAQRLLDSANDDETQAIAGVGFALLALYELLDERLPRLFLGDGVAYEKVVLTASGELISEAEAERRYNKAHAAGLVDGVAYEENVPHPKRDVFLPNRAGEAARREQALRDRLGQ